MNAVTLEEAISQFVNLGESDPLTIARKVESRFGNEWLAEQAAAHWEDLVVQMARALLGSQRRGSEVALRAGDEVSAAELRLRSYWVPEVGWKKAGRLTSSDLNARAAWYDALGVAAFRRAAWCREVAGLMEAEGAKELGRLKASLPPLPDEDLPRELAA